ncbi:MAG: glycosyl hydrolase family protein, partial [Flavobacteriales bacterium]
KNINENGAYWDPVFGTTNWPACGEIDIMEHGIFPSEDIDYIGSALHSPCCYGGNPNAGGTIANNLENQFHVYSVNWSPDQITFLLDGVGFYTYNPVIKDENTWPFFEDQYILLNVAMGGVAGPIDPQYTESAMIIDYVKVYQENPLNIEESINSQNTKALKIFPNPVKNEINLVSKEPIVQLKLYNYQGKLVLEKNKNTDFIDVTSFDSGIYFIEAFINNEKSLHKVIIE